MNKTFKIVFNKARGALMVANEMTSSVQKKGVRTIVAGTALALASTAACALTAYEWADSVPVLSQNTLTINGNTVTDAGALYFGVQVKEKASGTLNNLLLNISAIGPKDEKQQDFPIIGFANGYKTDTYGAGSPNTELGGDSLTISVNTDFIGGGNNQATAVLAWQDQKISAKEVKLSAASTNTAGKSVYGIGVGNKSTLTLSSDRINIDLATATDRGETEDSKNIYSEADGIDIYSGATVDASSVNSLIIKGKSTGKTTTTDNLNGGSPITGIVFEGGTGNFGGTTDIELSAVGGNATGIKATNYFYNSTMGQNWGNAAGTLNNLKANVSSETATAAAVAVNYTTGQTNEVILAVNGNADLTAKTATGKAYGVSLAGNTTAKLTGNVTINASATDAEGSAAGVKVSTGTVELGSAGKSVSVTANGLGGANTNKAIALWADSGATLTVKGDTITLNASERGVKAQGGATVNLGTAETSRIDITDGDMGIFALQGHVNVKGKALNVTSSGEYGLHVQSNTQDVTAPTNAASLIINADKTTVVNSSTNGLGLSAFSNGQLTVNSNLSVTADHALDVRGNSTVNINTDGKHTTQLAGDIVFETASNGSGNLINAYVNATLSGADSSWNGRSYQEYAVDGENVQRVLLDVKTDGDDEAKHHGNVTDFSLTLANGAKWTLTGDSFVNSLTLENGGTVDTSKASVLNIGTASKTGTVLHLTGKGTNLAIGSNTTLNVSGLIQLDAGTELETSFANAYSGVTIKDNTLTNLNSAASRLTFTGSTSGTLVIADAFNYETTEQLSKLTDIYSKFVILSLTGAKFTGEGNTKLVDGVVQNNATATVETKTNADGKSTATIGSTEQAVSTGAQTLVINTKDGEKAEVTVAKDSSLTITGKTEGSATENAFIENASNVTLNEGATLNLGSSSASSSDNVVKGSLVDLTLDKATLNVTNAEVSASELKLTNASAVNMTNATVTATALDLGENSSMSVTNSAVTTPTLTLDKSAAVTVDGGSITAEKSLDLGNSAKLEVTNASVETPKLTLADSATVKVTSGSVTTQESLALGTNAKLEVTSAAVSTPTLSLGNSAAVTMKEATVTADAMNLGEKASLTVEKSTVTTTALEGAKDVKITLGTKDSAGSLHTATLALNNALIFLDPAWVDGVEVADVENASFFSASSVSNANGTVVAGQNSVVALGATKSDAIAAIKKLSQMNDGFFWGQKGLTAGLYLGQTFDATNAKILVNGKLTSAPSESDVKQGVTIQSQGLLAINQKSVGSKAITGKLTLEDNSYIGLVDVTGNELTLADDVVINGKVTVGTDNPFVGGTLSGKTIKTALTPTGGLAALASTGMQSMTRRADAVLAQTIADRTSVDQDYAAGTALWVDVTGERYQADKLENNASFKSDMGYGAFGGDFAITEDISAGAAIQYGKGTVRSSVSSIKNSIDSYGITAYGSMKFGDAKVVAEASYIKNENDITSSQTALNQSVDTEVYSLGIRGQHRFTAGSFQFVPSVGVRVSRLNTDAMKVGSVTVKKQEQTLVQVPIALRINGFEQNAGGWSVAPSFKIAYVPTFGDKEISVLGADQTVIDTSPVQGDFGIRAQKGNLLLNANFMVGGGKDGTSSVGGKAGLKYVF